MSNKNNLDFSETYTFKKSSYQSPSKKQTDNLHELPTDYKTRTPKDTNSKYPSPQKQQEQTIHQQNYQENGQNIQKRLQEIEQEVKQIGNKLKEIHYNNLRLGWDKFQEKKALEDERLELRKRLIDLSADHQHLINQKQSKKSNQKEPRISKTSVSDDEYLQSLIRRRQIERQLAILRATDIDYDLALLRQRQYYRYPYYYSYLYSPLDPLFDYPYYLPSYLYAPYRYWSRYYLWI